MSSQSGVYKRDRSTGTRRLANLQPSKSRVAGGGGGRGAVGGASVGKRGGGIVISDGVAARAPTPIRQKSRGPFASPLPSQGKGRNSPPQSQRLHDEEKGSNRPPPIALYEDEKRLRKPRQQSPVIPIPGGDVDGGGRIRNKGGVGPLHRGAGRQQPNGGGGDANGQVFFAARSSGPAGRALGDHHGDELVRTARRLRIAVVGIWSGSNSKHARVLGLGLVCLASLFFLLSHSNRRATTDLASFGGHETTMADGELVPLGGKNQSAPGAKSGTSALSDASAVSAKKAMLLPTLKLNITSNVTGSLAARTDSNAVEGTEPPKYVSPSSGAATEDKKFVVPKVSNPGKGGGVKNDDDASASPSKARKGGKEGESTARQRGVEGENERQRHVDAAAAAPTAPPLPPTAEKDVASTPAGHENKPKGGENAAAAVAAVASTPKAQSEPAVVASTPEPEPKPKPMLVPVPPSFPPALEANLADVSVPYDPERDVPYFWHVALSGGTAMEKMFATCYHLVQAADVQHGKKKNTGDQALSVIRVYGNMYVNLDVTTSEGIALAKEKNLVSSRLADVVVTTTVQETADIFTPQNRGRLFTLFHHPVERAVSMFYYLQRATYDPGYHKDLANMTIVDYARSNYVEHNWMTRFLANKRGGSITREHLDVAKEVVRRKCIVGLTSEFAASVEKFEDYFGWHATRESERARECRDRLVKDRDRRHYHPTYEEGSEVWNLLASHNVFDLELFDYATSLFF